MNQLELFDSPTIPQKQPLAQKRNVHAEAKEILERAGISEWSKELKALVAAKLMREHFPEGAQLMLQTLATTAIKTDANPRI